MPDHFFLSSSPSMCTYEEYLYRLRPRPPSASSLQRPSRGCCSARDETRTPSSPHYPAIFSARFPRRSTRGPWPVERGGSRAAGRPRTRRRHPSSRRTPCPTRSCGRSRRGPRWTTTLPRGGRRPLFLGDTKKKSLTRDKSISE